MRLFGLEFSLSRRYTGGLSPVADNRGGWSPWRIREPFTGAWQRNQEWTTDTVLAHHAVYACITRIAQDFGKLRPKLVERDDNGIWTEVDVPSPFWPALRTPNRFQNHIQFKESWAISKLTRGNTYCLIERDLRGVPSAFYLLDPNRVKVLVSPDGAVFYELQADNLAGLPDIVTIPASEIIHDRMNCLYHPLVGTSPIFACGTAANMGLQIQQNSSAFFGNGSNPSGVLVAPQAITAEKALEMSSVWNAQFTGANAGKVAVLGGGLTFTQMRMSAVDSQTIEQLKWTAETVCSTFHVPPWKIGVGEQPAYTKPEIANQAYYSDCLQSPIEQWELCMDGAFGFDSTTEGRWLGVELDLDGLLRMDVAGQYDVMVKAAGGAVLTPDEARRKLDQPPLPGGDTLYRQQQEYSLEALAKRDAQDDPFGTKPAPALPAGEPQKQLAAGDQAASPEDVARFARHVARRARTLRVRAISWN